MEEADHRHQVRRAFAAAKRLAAGAVIGAQLVAQFRCDEDHAAILPSMAIDPSGSGSGSSSLAAISVSARKASRSEKHTSELQSIMRISYAVFCLKKKKNRTEL